MPAEWDHLSPIVDALVRTGNTPVNGGFIGTQGGQECPMTQTLDFALLGGLVLDDESIELVPDEDLLWCRHCWAAIYGPGHEPELRDRS